MSHNLRHHEFGRHEFGAASGPSRRPVLESGLGLESAGGLECRSFSALTVLALTYRIFPKEQRFVRSARAVKFFACAGICLAVTLYFLFSAIRLGEVSRVMAIMGATPMLSVAMAAVFLGDLERITVRTYIGTAWIVLGVVLTLEDHVRKAIFLIFRFDLVMVISGFLVRIWEFSVRS